VATRLYLRDTPSREAPPGASRSAALKGQGHDWGGLEGKPFIDRSLLTVRGETLPESVFTMNSLAHTDHDDQAMARFTSRKLAAQTISANTWTIAVALSEAAIAANSELMVSVYVWRPLDQTVVGYIWDAHTVLGAEWAATLDGIVSTFAGSAVVASAGDVIALEVWRHTAGQGSAAVNLQKLYFNGYVDVVDATTADPASYLETPQNLTFATPELPVSISGVFVETMGFVGPICMADGDLYVVAEGTELTPNPNWWKSSDGGKTWTKMDSANQPAGSNWNDLECWVTIVDGTILRSMRQRSGASNNNVTCMDFDTATDTWKSEAGRSVTCVAATDTFTLVAHGFQGGDGVIFSGLTGGAGITPGTLYYVRAANLTANTFEVSASAGGSSIDVTTDLTAGTVTRRWSAIKSVQAGTLSQQGVCLVRRSNGDEYAFYMRYDTATSTSAVYKKRAAGGGWGAETLVKANVSQVLAIVGAADLIHVVVKEDTSAQHGGATNTVFHASLSTGDAFSSFEAVNDTAIHGLSSIIVSPMVYYDDAGDEKIYVVWGDATGLLRGAFITNDGTPGPEEQVGMQKVWYDPLDTAQFQPVASIAVDTATKKIYCVYANNPSFTVTAMAPFDEADLYLAVRDPVLGWGNNDIELLDSVRVQIICCNVYTHAAGNGGKKVVGMFYDDANGPYYHEYEIPAEPAPMGDKLGFWDRHLLVKAWF
jgi:hypothetical protein